MITKFKTLNNDSTSIEFKREEKNILISIEKNDFGALEYLDVKISEENLFSLIGQLLRLQSEIKKLD